MIPQTLLWVGLIVAWLVVLVPMLAARHPKVNQVSDALLKTRLLHRGGSAKLASRRKVRPMPSASSPEVSDALDGDARAMLVEDDEVLFHGVSARPHTADDLDEAQLDQDELDADAHAYVDPDVGELTFDSPMEGDTTPIAKVRRADVTSRMLDEAFEPEPMIARIVDAEPMTANDDAPQQDVAEDAPLEEEVRSAEIDFHDDQETTELAPAVRPEESAESESEAHADTVDEAAEADSELDSDEFPADEALTEEVAPVQRADVERAADDEAETDEAETESAFDADDLPAVSRSRRGGFDPENDARLSEARFRFRQRVTILLGVLAVVALGAGLMNVPFAWFGFGAVVLALVGYLTYLRRTVRIETEIRRRRMARLERARREREREAEVLDGIPAHMRRGGCVVMEIDDEDPAFDHLPRYRAEEFEFLQRESDLRETLERKVG